MGEGDRVGGAIGVASHVFALCAFAIAQPLYDLLGNNAEFFVARNSEPIDLVLFSIFLSLLLPAAIAVVTIAIGLPNAALRRGAYSVCVTLLSACVALPIVDRFLSLPGWGSVLSAGVLGIGFVFLLSRVSLIRSFLSLLSGATLVFPVFFLQSSPVASILVARDAALSGAAVDSRTPIVVVVFDCLPVTALMTPDREIDAVAFPNFARLARQSTWYRNATTVGISTELAVPALLSGRYPVHDRLPTASHYPQNLFTWLGWSRPIAAFEATTHLCPDVLCGRDAQPIGARLAALGSDTLLVYLHVLLPDDLSGDLPQIETRWSSFDVPTAPREAGRVREPGLFRALAGGGARERVGKTLDYLKALPQQARDSLFYLHVYLPHGPFVYLPTGRRYVSSSSKLSHGVAVDDAPDTRLRSRLGERRVGLGRQWTSHEELIVRGSQRMLMQIGFADIIVGEIMQAFERNDLWEDALVVVTSDHGESYNPRKPIRSPRDANTAHVPLFLKLPGQRRGTIDDRNAETIDVLPTLADALGVASPWEMDGTSLLASDAGRSTKRMYTPRSAKWSERSWPDSGLPDALARLNALVGPGRTAESLLRVGPRPDLLGRRAADLGFEAVVASVAQREDLRRVDPESGFVPAYLTGQLRGPNLDSAPVELAVAVNGVVQATTRAFPDASGKGGFTAFVPETAFRPGSNRVDLFEIPGPRGP